MSTESYLEAPAMTLDRSGQADIERIAAVVIDATITRVAVDGGSTKIDGLCPDGTLSYTKGNQKHSEVHHLT
jgi:hypothetical protein